MGGGGMGGGMGGGGGGGSQNEDARSSHLSGLSQDSSAGGAFLHGFSGAASQARPHHKEGSISFGHVTILVGGCSYFGWGLFLFWLGSSHPLRHPIPDAHKSFRV